MGKSILSLKVQWWCDFTIANHSNAYSCTYDGLDVYWSKSLESAKFLTSRINANLVKSRDSPMKNCFTAIKPSIYLTPNIPHISK